MAPRWRGWKRERSGRCKPSPACRAFGSVEGSRSRSARSAVASVVQGIQPLDPLLVHPVRNALHRLVSEPLHPAAANVGDLAVPPCRVDHAPHFWHPQALVFPERLADAPTTRKLVRQQYGVLDGLCTPLSQIRRHRVRGVAQQDHPALPPLRERQKVVQIGADDLVHGGALDDGRNRGRKICVALRELLGQRPCWLRTARRGGHRRKPVDLPWSERREPEPALATPDLPARPG